MITTKDKPNDREWKDDKEEWKGNDEGWKGDNNKIKLITIIQNRFLIVSLVLRS